MTNITSADMAESKEGKEQKVGSSLTVESVRGIAESVGIGNLSDEAAAFLAEECTYSLKEIVQVRDTACYLP